MARTERDHHDWQFDLGAYPTARPGRSRQAAGGRNPSSARASATPPPVRRADGQRRAARWLLPLVGLAVVLGTAGVTWQLLHLRGETEALRRSTAERARAATDGEQRPGGPQERLVLAAPPAGGAETGDAVAVQSLLLAAPPGAGPASAPTRPATASRGTPRVLENAPGGVPVTKCVGGGRTTYVQDGVCPPGQSPVTVQLRPLNAAEAPPRNAAARPVAAPASRVARNAVPAASQGSPARPAGNLRDCVSLARQIEQLDAQARQPHSAAEQDRLTERRRALRSRQAEWGC